MCGIAGLLSIHSSLVRQERVKTMTDAIQHRGPDGEGFWMDEAQSVCLGHRRLAIIDTSAAGNQPFHYLHYTLVFNGEIYNYLELKERLAKQGYVFTTQSDSEVIPAAFDHWGIDCLQQFDGMFAFALYDNRQQKLFIARDRFGEKPLYYHARYAQRGAFEQFAFASEMKALWALGIEKQMSGTMMLNYLTLGYTQNPIKATQTFYNNILSLPAGHYLTIQPKQGKVQMKRWYWQKNLQQDGLAALGDLQTSTQTDATVALFQSLLQTSVLRRLRSDVPLGTSLSGGLDSTAIAATLLTHHPQGLNSFSAVFPGFKMDESAYIHAFQQHYQHTELRTHFVTPTEQDFITHWAKLSYHQEEPVQSSSVLTQYMVYRLAKEQGVTVLLDGQGADEVLGGYKKYMPWYLLQLLQEKQFAHFIKEKKLLYANDFLSDWSFKNYAAALLPALAAKQLQQKAINSQQQHPFLDAEFYHQYHNDSTLTKPTIHTLDDMLHYNTFTQGLQELLRYADRNSMAHSREVRLPFLQHDLVGFLFSLPVEYKVRDGFTKWILRKAVSPLLPDSIAWRKGKIGYEPPQQQWMQQPAIADMIHESKKQLVHQHILSPKVLSAPVKAQAAHAADNFDWRYLSGAAVF